ncbi:MAG: hypothetical protein ACD_79C00328G0007 [uncultured bacterium]|nr:MAG: hypothetical protein ACD_79C00328G0007 [uncultured bacterium]
MKEIHCPGCGKALHKFFVPTKEGVYRLRCKANNSKLFNVKVDKEGNIKSEDILRPDSK